MSPASTARTSARGTTLVEVLVASTLAVVGIVGLLGVMPQAYRQTKTSGRISQLTHLAARQAEHLRSLDYANSDLVLGIHPAQQVDSTGSRYYPIATWPEEYSLRWRVLAGPTDGTNTPEPEIKTVVVEATFRLRYETNGDPNPTNASLEVTHTTFVTP